MISFLIRAWKDGQNNEHKQEVRYSLSACTPRWFVLHLIFHPEREFMTNVHIGLWTACINFHIPLYGVTFKLNPWVFNVIAQITVFAAYVQLGTVIDPGSELQYATDVLCDSIIGRAYWTEDHGKDQYH